MTEIHDTALDVSENLAQVLERLSSAIIENDLANDTVKLIAVSKVQSIEKIERVILAGQRIFGENRVQEAATKWPALKNSYPDIELHLIGPLQTNKIKQAISLFDVIETLDRPKLAKALKIEMQKLQVNIPCYIQVNTGEEEQKAGIHPMDAEEFVKYCRDDLFLNIVGLMCIPPADEEPGLHFALLKSIASRSGLENLSMGMSSDFEKAIGFGATHVRVGSSIFGERPNLTP